MRVSMEDAYAEACRALGEAIVRERLLTAELAHREASAGGHADHGPGNVAEHDSTSPDHR